MSNNQIFTNIPSEIFVAKSEHSFEIEDVERQPVGTIFESNKVEFHEIDAYWLITFGFVIESHYKCLNCKFILEARSENIASQNYEYTLTLKSHSGDLFTSANGVLAKTSTYNNANYLYNIRNHFNDKGALKILVTVTINCKEIVPTKFKFHDLVAARADIVSSLGFMLEDSTFSDFTFIVKGKNFKVHRTILAAASKVFLKLFTTNMQESLKNECLIDEIEPEDFGHLIRFIYCGSLPENLTESSMGLYEAAHYYGIERLKTICLQEISAKLTTENALEIYNLSFLYEVDHLKAEAWKIIKRDILKIFFPLKNELLSPDEVKEIVIQRKKEEAFWEKFKDLTI